MASTLRPMAGLTRGGRRTRPWVIGLLLAALAAAAAPATTLAADPDPDPILLVHGYRGDPSTWADMIAKFNNLEPSRTAVAIDLASEDNVKNAAQIRAFIAAQFKTDERWAQVDIVAQSMGGLSARHYIKFIDDTIVDAYVSLGTPQYGLYSACLLPSSYGGQMCPTRTFLRNLNSGDDTPNKVYWTTIYSRTDGVVPTSASRLDGGACFVYENPGVPHDNMDNDPEIFRHVLDAVDRVCRAGTFK